MRIDIDHLASLSGLSLSEQEKHALYWDMEELISFADRIKTDSERINEAPFFPHGEADVVREDTPGDSLTAEQLLFAAKEKRDGYITVPRVLSEKGAKNE